MIYMYIYILECGENSHTASNVMLSTYRFNRHVNEKQAVQILELTA